MSAPTKYPLDDASADAMHRAILRGGADAAARLTVSWSRRQLIWTCVTLAARLTSTHEQRPERPASVTPAELKQARRLATIADESQWTAEELREAHVLYGHHGDRTPWVVAGERIYQRQRKRRSRKAAA